MKKLAKKNIKNFCLFGLLSCLLLFLGSCSDIQSYGYAFKNETQYTITITVSRSYWIRQGETSVEKSKSDSIWLYGNSSVSITANSNDLGFQWTTNSPANNSKIYSDVSGHRVVFKER